jgi:hypothetical protein
MVEIIRNCFTHIVFTSTIVCIANVSGMKTKSKRLLLVFKLCQAYIFEDMP